MAAAGLLRPKIVPAVFQYEHFGSRPLAIFEYSPEFSGDILIGVRANAVVGNEYRIFLLYRLLRLSREQRERNKSSKKNFFHIDSG